MYIHAYMCIYIYIYIHIYIYIPFLPCPCCAPFLSFVSLLLSSSPGILYSTTARNFVYVLHDVYTCMYRARICTCVNTVLYCITAYIHLLRREGGHPVLYNAVYIYYIQAARCCTVLHSTCIKLCTLMHTPEGPCPNLTRGTVLLHTCAALRCSCSAATAH